MFVEENQPRISRKQYDISNRPNVLNFESQHSVVGMNLLHTNFIHINLIEILIVLEA